MRAKNLVWGRDYQRLSSKSVRQIEIRERETESLFGVALPAVRRVLALLAVRRVLALLAVR